jgi:hypothetical protein
MCVYIYIGKLVSLLPCVPMSPTIVSWGPWVPMSPTIVSWGPWAQVRHTVPPRRGGAHCRPS